jgi:hypothetical protein
VQEGTAGSALPGTAVSRAVAEDAVAVGESRSWPRSRSRFWARSMSLLESVAALWFSGESIACLLAVTVLRVLHLVASGAFIFFRGGVAVAASPVAAAVAGEGAAVAEAPAVVLAAAAPVKGTAVAKAAAVALAAAAPLEGAAVTEAAAVVLAAAASVLGFVAAVALAAAMDGAAAVGPGSEACLPPCIRWAPLCLLWENCCFPAAEGDLLNTSPRFQLNPGPHTPLNTLPVYSKQVGGH